MMSKLTANRKQLLLLFVFLVVAIMFWNTFLIYPIKLFVVMLHELSHGLMAELFGGDIINIQIDYRIGGYCRYTVPDSFVARIMIASGGYLGSLIWGALILLGAVYTDKDRVITLAIGLVLLFLSWFVIKTGEPFGIAMTVGFALFMILSARFLSDNFHDYFLKFIGMMSCLYVIIDIKDDLILRSGVGSDADAIAGMTGIPSVAIGVIWLLLSAAVIYFTIKIGYKRLN